MTTILELLLQLLEVIDLAVEDNTHRAVFIEDWLMSTFNVDNAQATHPQGKSRKRSAVEIPFVIRSAMNHSRVHPPHQRRRVSLLAEINYSADATHENLREVSRFGFWVSGSPRLRETRNLRVEP